MCPESAQARKNKLQIHAIPIHHIEDTENGDEHGLTRLHWFVFIRVRCVPFGPFDGYFWNSCSRAFGAPMAHENGFYWERGRLARRIWPIPAASRYRRAFAAFGALLLIAWFLKTTAGEDARAPSVHLFSEQTSELSIVWR
jgi:hypothetical protein